MPLNVPPPENAQCVVQPACIDHGTLMKILSLSVSHYDYSVPDRGARSIVMSVSVCVCLFAIVSPELHVLSAPNFCT